ncbi:MAG TPA: hypothetical protein VIT68_00660, partial [Candidatus Gracilibacteria bacterium]
FRRVLFRSLALVGLLYLMRKPYTEMTKKSFYQDSSIATKLHIAEILSHEGHSRAVHILGASVIDKDANIFVREKAIEQITLVGDPSIFQLYVRILEDETESTDIKIKVLESLMGIKALRKYLKENPFSRYKLVEILEALYLNPSHGHIRKLALMNLFAHMPPYDLVPFFLEKVQTQDVYLKCICLRSVAEIFEDPAMVVYTESFLENPHPRIKGHAIIALWKFYDKDKLRGILETLLSDDEEAEIIAAIYAIGEIKDIKSLPAITRYLAHDSLEVRMHVLVAMAKLEDYRCLNCMMAILFGDNEASAQDMFNMIRRTSPDFQSRLRQEVQYRVSAEVMSVLEYAEIDESGGTLSLAVLGRLKHLYRLAGRFGDLWSLEQITPKAT